jgi:hypothetical protein
MSDRSWVKQCAQLLPLLLLATWDVEAQDSERQFFVGVVTVTQQIPEIRLARIVELPNDVWVAKKGGRHLSEHVAEVPTAVEQHDCQFRITPSCVTKQLVQRS